MSDTPASPVFNGRYRLERKLAQGGMAEVYLGFDLVLQRPVALKVLSGELSRDAGFVARFRREAQAAASLNHPNIVGVYDWGEADGSYYIVMEYVEGRTLARLLAAEGALPAGRVAAIGGEIAAGLAAAHRSGVIHRDVKPANVLIDRDGRVKVTDFGIARVASANTQTQLTLTGMVVGTATYLSPEQAEGRPVDARSDIYSLGVVLYEMAAGRPPFSGDTPLSIAYQHAHQLPEPPSRHSPEVPIWLEAVIMRAVAKNPAERYQNADELRLDLKASRPPGVVADGGVLPAEGATTQIMDATRRHQPPTLIPPQSRGRRRWYAVAAFITALLVAAGLGAYFGLDRISHSHAATPPPPARSATPAKTTSTSSVPSTSTTLPTTTLPATTLPTSFAGYQIVAGTGSNALYCPSGIALGHPGQNSPAGNAHGGTPGAGGHGGRAGCASNGGNGGHGGDGAPGRAGGAGGDGGDGGCLPSTLDQMRHGVHPCDGSGSNGGNGGDGGNAAPVANGGAGGAGGHGGNTQGAKGGNGGKGGNAKPGLPGAPGSPGQPGGGPSSTTPGVKGADGANG